MAQCHPHVSESCSHVSLVSLVGEKGGKGSEIHRFFNLNPQS